MKTDYALNVPVTFPPTHYQVHYVLDKYHVPPAQRLSTEQALLTYLPDLWEEKIETYQYDIKAWAAK